MRLTYLRFRVICAEMIVIMLGIAGRYLMEITSESEASIFAMTNQRSSIFLSLFSNQIFIIVSVYAYSFMVKCEGSCRKTSAGSCCCRLV